jgi:hypothetical protein
MNTIGIQRLLAVKGYYFGDLDGDVGIKTIQGAQKVLEINKLKIPINNSMCIIMAAQVLLRLCGFTNDVGPVDGFYGPSTKYAFSLWDYQQVHGNKQECWREDDWSENADYPSCTSWPNLRTLIKFYGNPGSIHCHSGEVNLPFPMKLAWDTSTLISHFYCHELVADSAQRAYKKIHSAYSEENIALYGLNIYGGCYNNRNKRGGSTPSTHAFGAAIDHDPCNNRLRWGRLKARLANPSCEEFWRIWESEGWVSLGRTKNYDWMHIQAVKL